ncbi:Protein of unknown function (DUF3558) [Actinokineospora globicatena]|nr:Protein of unknown function (DUF3558) [Actinokineospora globicatena]GLW81698.1 hypothetical protein Aglo01_61790 [Actinokineospora globicatena]GLW88493.1 hypothetical protein Aglo02_61320 [Actinokineospora globicatena]
MKPCELLPDSTHQALGITGQPKPRQVTGVTWCDWRVRKDSAADSYTISVGYYPALGLKDLRTAGPAAPVDLGGRTAVQGLGPDNIGCIVSIELTASSRVDVMGIGGDPAELCAPALDAAKVVERELP